MSAGQDALVAEIEILEQDQTLMLKRVGFKPQPQLDMHADKNHQLSREVRDEVVPREEGYLRLKSNFVKQDQNPYHSPKKTSPIQPGK